MPFGDHCTFPTRERINPPPRCPSEVIRGTARRSNRQAIRQSMFSKPPTGRARNTSTSRRTGTTLNSGPAFVGCLPEPTRPGALDRSGVPRVEQRAAAQ